MIAVTLQKKSFSRSQLVGVINPSWPTFDAPRASIEEVSIVALNS